MFLAAYDLLLHKTLYARTNFRHFTNWPLLMYPRLTISYKKFLFHFHCNKVGLYVFILRLAYSYWLVFCNLVNFYIDELASAIGIPVFIKYRIFTNNKAKITKAFFKNHNSITQYNVLSNLMIIINTYWE